MKGALKGTLQVISKADSISWGDFSLKMYTAHVLTPVFVKCNLWLCNWTLQSPQAILCLKRSVYGHSCQTTIIPLNLSSTTAWMNLLGLYWNTDAKQILGQGI